MIAQHLDAIAATVEILRAQIAAARQTIPSASAVPQETMPARCHGIPGAQCAIRDEEARRPLMGGVVVCVGCQERLTA
jgi:hypothetical protein